jgi:hypothetical protein
VRHHWHHPSGYLVIFGRLPARRMTHHSQRDHHGKSADLNSRLLSLKQKERPNGYINQGEQLKFMTLISSIN